MEDASTQEEPKRHEQDPIQKDEGKEVPHESLPGERSFEIRHQDCNGRGCQECNGGPVDEKPVPQAVRAT
jgi:hypothetical protein